MMRRESHKPVATACDRGSGLPGKTAVIGSCPATDRPWSWNARFCVLPVRGQATWHFLVGTRERGTGRTGARSGGSKGSGRRRCREVGVTASCYLWWSVAMLGLTVQVGTHSG